MLTNGQLLERLERLQRAAVKKNLAYASKLSRVTEALRHEGRPASTMPLERLLGLANANKAIELSVRRLAAGDAIDNILQRTVPAAGASAQRRTKLSAQVLEEFVESGQSVGRRSGGGSADADGGGSWDNTIKTHEESS